MELGGAERALLGMLYAIDTDKYDVDLFINQHTGAFMSLIPKNVHLLSEIPAYSAIERPIKDVIREGHWAIGAMRLLNKAVSFVRRQLMHITNDGTGSHRTLNYVSWLLPSLHYLGEYDLAISYLDPPHIVQDKVLAKKKIEWIHTDFSGRQFSYDPKLTLARWAANDYIMSISDDVTKQFLVNFPSLENKIRKMENIIPAELVRAQATEFFPEEYKCNADRFIICSVGRISHAKNFECIPVVSKILKESGLNFYWCIVGPGDVVQYNALAKDNGVGDSVEFIGSRDNPYPYMQYCNIYVQPSRFEGKAVTVQEAQMLARPVLITRYPTSGSQIVDGEDGLICEMDNESIAEALARLMEDKDLCNRLGKRAHEMHPGNDEEVEVLYRIINDNL